MSLITYTASGDIGTGQSGAYADATGIKFDDAKFYDSTRREPLTPRIAGATDASISSGTLLVQDLVRGEHWSPEMIRADLRGGIPCKWNLVRAAAVSLACRPSLMVLSRQDDQNWRKRLSADGKLRPSR